MNSSIQNLLIKLLGSLALLFVVHYATLHFSGKDAFIGELVYAYLINAILAGGISLLFYKLENKYREQLGFLFLGASLFKLVVFFGFLYAFNPELLGEESVTILEFSGFFIPYALSMLFESRYLIYLVNKT